ncbi:MAG: M1 family metallopeptidase [Croceitalea sp.]|nr:M1 family metallopeptidase [Croceitalea sp.]
MRSVYFIFLLFFAHNLQAQNKPSVDFIQAAAQIKPQVPQKNLEGTVNYQFKVNQKIDSLFLDAQNISFNQITLNDENISYLNTGQKLIIPASLPIGSYELKLHYVAIPKQTVYFLGWDDSIEGNEQIWTQGQGKYTSHWLPSFDDMTEKVEFDLAITFDKKYQVIANGELLEKVQKDNLITWHFDMKRPMSSYLAAFAIGDFDKKELVSASGIPIELYYNPNDSLKVEPTYRYTQEIFDFLEDEIGVPYPWQNYKQVPVQDFLYAGMENTGTTIFSNSFMVDSIAFVDKNYVNVNAHELAHQWFGNLVTEVSAEHHWLHEGFATYYAYLSDKHILGDDYFYWKLYESARTLNSISENGEGEALTNPKASSLTFYEKGAWALIALKNAVGEKAFKMGMANYLKKYAFQNVTIKDFLQEIKNVAALDLTEFENQWLKSTTFPWEIAKNFLVNNCKSVKEYSHFKSKLEDQQIEANINQLLWNDSLAVPFKRQLLFDGVTSLGDSTLLNILNNEPLKVRQALAIALPMVNEDIRSDFDNLLEDESYVTQETALFKLWDAFPEQRRTYLNKTKGVEGFSNKNIKLLWLTLALITPDFEVENKQAFYVELNNYTAPQYHFEIRQLAFQYLSQINALSDTAIAHLIGATNHHVWQFKKASIDILTSFIAEEENKERVIAVGYLLSEEEKAILSKFLTP